MTTKDIPVLEEWSADLANDVLREKQLTDAETTTEAEIKTIVSMQGTDSHRQVRAAIIAEGKTPPPDLDTPQLDAKIGQLGDIRLARKIHREKMAETRRREGARLCLELKPAFDASAKRLAAAAVEAHAAVMDMTKLESNLKGQGVGFYPTVCNLDTESVFGYPTDRTSNFAMFLRECIQFKYLKEMPKELR